MRPLRSASRSRFDHVTPTGGEAASEPYDRNGEHMPHKRPNRPLPSLALPCRPFDVLKEGLDERVGLEQRQVLRLLAHADVLHR